MKLLKKTLIVAVILAVCLVSVKFTGRTPVRADGGELGRIVFDGDSTYEWSHFYSIGSKTETISDLNITVLDSAGKTVPSSAYTIKIYASWWDEAEGGEVRLEQKAPYGIVYNPGGSDGFCEFSAVASAVEGSGYTGEIEAAFHIMDSHCLEWICAKTVFEGNKKADGWRMFDRTWIDLDKLKAPVVTANDGTVLVEGKNYNITYYTRKEADLDSFETDRDEIAAGVDKLDGLPDKAGGYIVKLEGISPYYGGTTILLDVESDVKEVTPKVELSDTEYIYDGKAKKPAVKVLVGEEVLEESEYTVKYASGRKKAGTYDVTVTLKGKYTGTASASFRIVMAEATAKKASAGKKAFTLKWTKQSEAKVSGYQIEYSTDKSFKTDAKTVKVKGNGKTKKKVSKLESGKVYYVRIRTYTKVGSKTYYSEWSESVKVKTK